MNAPFTPNLHDDVAWGPSGKASDVPPKPGGGPNPLEELAPNKADISKHLYALFAPEFVRAYPDAWIEIAYANPATGGDPDKARNFSAFDLEKAVEFAMAQNGAGFNIYVGAALRHGEQSYSGRASGNHVLAASHAWAEYDGAGDDERIAAILRDKSLVPAIIPTTGTVPHPRRHLYFKLDGSAKPDEVRAANASLKILLGSDKVQNPDRVMRLAGTVNYPSPKKQAEGYVAEIVTLHQNRDARAYSLDELIGVAPGGGRGRGYNETEEKPASTVESFFKDVNALALTRLSHWVKPLFGTLVRFYQATGAWRTTPEANKALDGRSHLEEAISISQRGVWDYGFEKPSDPITLVKDYGPRGTLLAPLSAKDAALWLCQQINIAPEALGWGGSRERRSADDAGYENGYDYEHDFGNAGAQSSNADKPPRFLFETIADLRSGEEEEYLIELFVPERSTGLFWGKWGSFKTFAAFDWAFHLAYGFKDWHGAKLPGEPCHVLIIAREGKKGFVKRINAFKKHHGLTEDSEHLTFMRSAISFLDNAGFAELKKAIKELKKNFRLVLVDTVGRVLPGEDMAKEQPITLFMERLQQVGEITGAVSIGVHHENKSGDANGSMYFQNNSDFMFSVTRDGDKLAGKLTCVKQKDGEDHWSRDITLVKVELEDGKSSLAVDSVSATEPQRKAEKKARPLSAGAQRVFDCINEAIINGSIDHRVGGGSGPAVKAADLKNAREEHRRRYVYQGDGDHKEKADAERQAWRGGYEALLRATKIGEAPAGERNLVWAIQ